MELLSGIPAHGVRSLALLPGAFNPPTRAHLALAEAALRHVDHVLLVLPAALPHKLWDGAAPEQRIVMMRQVVEGAAGLGAAVSQGGLFADMVEEARIWFPNTQLSVICGRDAAERIIHWDYGEPGAIDRMLQRFRLLVAARQGSYLPPDRLAHAVESLEAGEWDDFSSTSVRDALASGRESWRDLVPPSIQDAVEKIYGPEKKLFL